MGLSRLSKDLSLFQTKVNVPEMEQVSRHPFEMEGQNTFKQRNMEVLASPM